MGKGHIAFNKYISDKTRFADLINGKLFGGEQVVLPEELEKVEGESEILLEDKNGKTSGKTRYRDVVMRWKKGVDFCFFGCGNLDLYSMFQMSTMTKEKLQKYIPNYWINLVDADNIEDIACFRTDLQKIMGMLKCKNNKDELQKYMRENEAFFGHVDYNTSQAISEFLQSEKLAKKLVNREKEEGETDMCKALDDLYQEGIDLGEARGRAEQLVDLVKRKLERGDSVKKIADDLMEEVSVVEEIVAKL